MVLCFCPVTERVVAFRWANTTPTSMRVKYFPGTGSISKTVQPFYTVYGRNPPVSNTAKRGTLVVQPSGANGYVLVEVNDRPVECLLKCQNDCESHCS